MQNLRRRVPFANKFFEDGHLVIIKQSVYHVVEISRLQEILQQEQNYFALKIPILW